MRFPSRAIACYYHRTQVEGYGFKVHLAFDTMEEYNDDTNKYYGKLAKKRGVAINTASFPPNAVHAKYGKTNIRTNTDPPGAPLPYNFHCPTSIQLIVGKPGIQDARDLLKSFDLSICQISFDGTRFRFPSPHLTFNGRSIMEPARASIVKTYLQAAPSFVPQDQGIRTDGLASINSDVWSQAAVYPWNAPSGTAFSSPWCSGPGMVDQAIATLQHNFVVKLILRLQKYSRRGIEIDNCPDGALEETGLYVIGYT